MNLMNELFTKMKLGKDHLGVTKIVMGNVEPYRRDLENLQEEYAVLLGENERLRCELIDVKEELFRFKDDPVPIPIPG